MKEAKKHYFVEEPMESRKKSQWIHFCGFHVVSTTTKQLWKKSLSWRFLRVDCNEKSKTRTVSPANHSPSLLPLPKAKLYYETFQEITIIKNMPTIKVHHAKLLMTGLLIFHSTCPDYAHLINKFSKNFFFPAFATYHKILPTMLHAKNHLIQLFCVM